LYNLIQFIAGAGTDIQMLTKSAHRTVSRYEAFIDSLKYQSAIIYVYYTRLVKQKCSGTPMGKPYHLYFS